MVLLLRAATEDGVKAIHQNNLHCQWIFGCCFTGCYLIFPRVFLRWFIGGCGWRLVVDFRDVPRIVNHQLDTGWLSFGIFDSWTSWFFMDLPVLLSRDLLDISWSFAWFIGILVTYALGFCTLTLVFQHTINSTYWAKGTQRSGCSAAKLRKNW